MTLRLTSRLVPVVRCWLRCGWLWTLFAISAPAVYADDPAGDRRAQLEAAFATQLRALAARCDELNLTEQARLTRDWIVERGKDRQYLFVPMAASDRRELPASESDTATSWQRKFMELRAAHAEALFALARNEARRGDGPAAYQLLHEVLHHDPEHAASQRVLGYHPANAARVTRQPGTRAHPDFGWQRGRYWRIESEHYRITTNESADAGLQLARKLEAFHSIWRQVFFRYWSADESLAARFDGRNTLLGKRKKLAVVLFADRDEYIRQLQRYEPQIGISLGYYMKNQQTAFFYVGDSGIETTWYHEATHQLFQELGDAVSDVGESSNFWIVEGIAVYMESLTARQGFYTLGGVDADRLQYARARALNGEFYQPLASLVQMGRDELQRHAEIRRLYTQAAGISHFLMDGTDGQYRQPLIEFLTTLYLGRAHPNALAAHCQVDWLALDAQYKTYLNVRDEDLVHLNPPALVSNLALGRTEVTDVGVQQLSHFTNLEWLDLSFTQVTDAGLRELHNARQLKRLSLEGTAITDKSLEVIGQFSELEELDLSTTNITDAGLANLSNLKQLKSLWLTGTAIGDDSLVHMEALPQLELLDIDQTQITPAGLAALKLKRPQLNP